MLLDPSSLDMFTTRKITSELKMKRKNRIVTLFDKVPPNRLWITPVAPSVLPDEENQHGAAGRNCDCEVVR